MSHTCGVSSRRKLSEALAEANLESTELLMERLTAAAEAAGVAHSEIADLIGSDEVTIRAALARRIDVTLSDVQMIALAIGAHVGYTVTPNVDRELRALEDSTLQASVGDWHGADAPMFSPEDRTSLQRNEVSEKLRVGQRVG